MQISDYGERPDGSVIDLNGVVMSPEDRIKICRSVEELPASEQSIIDQITECAKEGLDFIIDGATGSGKSTTVGSLIRNVTGNRVIQTVPRVLAAKGLGDRISDILLAQTGDPQFTLGRGEIGFRTGAGKSGERIDMLSINTDGTQLRRMLQSDLYPDTLIIDEIQSKSIATDVLMERALGRKDMQIGVMSATINTSQIHDFLSRRGKPVPIIEIPGKIFPIKEHYNRKEGSYDKIMQLAKEGKHTLVIVSGKGEIEEWVSKLSGDLDENFEVVGLHAELSENEQSYVVEPLSNENITRIIIATNIAEESITIPYLDAVVDLGRHKVGIINSDGISELRIEPTPKANMKQRRGRVGRTKEGEYHRHCNTSIDDLHEYSLAEIENSTLEDIILLYANSNIDVRYEISRGAPAGGLFLHQVDKNLLSIGYKRLQRIGALDDLGVITPLGKDLLRISIDPFLGRMILESIQRACIEEIIIICSIFSVNGFLSKDGNWNRIKTGDRKKSDFLLYIDLLNLCTQKKLPEDMMARLVYLGVDREEMEEFRQKNGEIELHKVVDLDSLGIKNHKIQEVQNMIYKLQKNLKNNGIPINMDKKVLSKNMNEDSNYENLEACIASGYPFFVFKYDDKTSRFIHDDHDGKRSRESFKQASVSVVEVSQGTSHSYIGVPFILGPDEENDLNFGEFDTESFFDGDRPVKEDFALLSHISVINDNTIKHIQFSQGQYTSPFSEKTFVRRDTTARLRTLAEMDNEYTQTIADLQKGFSHEQFLLFTLPLFLITQNHRFKRITRQKNADFLETLYHRLRRFLKHNKGNYIHRISNSYEDIERSFVSDNDLFDDFRAWEKSMIHQHKKETKRGKTVNKKSADEIEAAANMFQLQRKYGEVRGQLTRANFDDEQRFDNKEAILTEQLITYLDLQSQTFSRMHGQCMAEVGGMSRKQKMEMIAQIKSSNNSKSSLRSFKTRIQDMNKFVGSLEKMKKYCDSSNQENYLSVKDELEEAETFIKSNSKNRTKELLASKSQRDKLLKGIKAIRLHYIDKKGEPRKQRAIASFGTSLTTFIDNYKAEILRYDTELAEARVRAEKERTTNLEFRNELAFFFQYLYEPEYYVEKIEPYLNSIIITILESDELRLLYIIENLVNTSFNKEKLKRKTHTKDLLDFLGNKEAFLKKVRILQRRISQFEKSNSKGSSELDEIISDLKTEIKSLHDERSLILS